MTAMTRTQHDSGPATLRIDNHPRVRIVCPRLSRLRALIQFFEGEPLMKAAATVLALILAVIAVVYLVVPAESLPTFFPGYEAGSARVHVKHGVISGVVALVLYGIGWWSGRR